MNVRVLSIIAVLFCCAFPTDIYSEPTHSASQEFQTNASFNLAVQKSKVLKLGKKQAGDQERVCHLYKRILCGQDERLEGSVFHPADHGGSSR